MLKITNPNTLEAGALKRIANSPDGVVLKRYLEANLSVSDQDNRIAEGVTLQRSQGKALILKDILDLLESK